MTRTHIRGWLIAALVAVVGTNLSAQQRTPDDDIVRNARLTWFWRQRQYPFGRIPAGAHERALRSMRELAGRAAVRGALPNQIPSPTFDVTAADAQGWTSLGPKSIGPLGSGFSGRVSTVVPHPTDPNIVYVATARGGVWKTVDRGASWTPLMDQACSLAFGALAIDPVRPDILYAGTGDYPWEPGCGALRSTDGGATWTALDLPAPSQVPRGFGSAFINKILILPSTAGSTSATTVLMATGLGIYRSTNSGATWSSVFGNGWYVEVEGLVADPNDEHILYASVQDFYGQGLEGVYKSTDAGLTWRLLPGLPGTNAAQIFLAISHSSPAILYAAFQRQSDYGTLGLYSSDDGGATWSPRAAAGINEFGWLLEVDPKTPTTVYWGGVRLRRSTDGGASFTALGINTHLDNHALTWSNAEPAMYLATDGGLYRSMDGGLTYQDLNTDLVITQYYRVAIEPGNPQHLLAGAQDNGIDEYTGGSIWAWPSGGDGGFVAFDPVSPTTEYGTIQWVPGGGYAIGPMRRDGTGFFQNKSAGINSTDRGTFIPPLVSDPWRAGTLYFGTYRIYRSSDRAESWQTISPDLSKGQGTITAIGVAASDGNTLYVGTSDGNVEVTNDGGLSWRAAIAGLPDRWITDFAVDPADAQHALVTVSGYGSGHVFQTSDGGKNWQDVSGNLPDLPVNAVVLIPGSGSVYLGTDLGVVRGPSSGGVWSAVMTGLPNTTISNMAYDPPSQLLVAATYGRGVFALSIPTVAVLRGDLNFDARVTPVDAQAILESLVGNKIPAGWTSTISGDADCDGKLSAADAQLVLSFAIGLPVNGACVGTRR